MKHFQNSDNTLKIMFTKKYRNRLIKKMILNGDDYGYLKITLPLFNEYIINTFDDDM